MRTKKLSQKLTLSKETISDLSRDEMKANGGGFPSDACDTVYHPRCQSIFTCDVLGNTCKHTC